MTITKEYAPNGSAPARWHWRFHVSGLCGAAEGWSATKAGALNDAMQRLREIWL